MGSRTKGYWVVFVIVLAVVITSVVMMRRGDERAQLWRYVAWGGIAVLVIARFVFRKPAPPTPPMPRD
jgi:cytochrome b561